jgi:phosphatidylinositol-3-phosphatase
VIVLIFENKEFGTVIGSAAMPNYNQWANQYTLLTQYYAITHPSLPNYIAMLGGDTFGIASDCEDCFVTGASLMDLIEASGRTWRTYQEDMPKPCFVGSKEPYAMKHNPFIYFDSIRNDPARCQQGIVPLSQLDSDLASGKLPNFVFISPNLCNDAHDCELSIADKWLGVWVNKILSSPAYDANTLIVLTWDEGQGVHGCCGYTPGGGRVPVVLISPLVRQNFQDDTPYTHYSFLKTISAAWGLKELGHAADPLQVLIAAPFQKP